MEVYGSVRISRTEMVQQASLLNGFLLHLPDRPEQRAREEASKNEVDGKPYITSANNGAIRVLDDGLTLTIPANKFATPGLKAAIATIIQANDFGLSKASKAAHVRGPSPSTCRRRSESLVAGNGQGTANLNELTRRKKLLERLLQNTRF